MLAEQYPYYLANQAIQANSRLEVTDKYTGKVATRTAMADSEIINQAIAAAVDATAAMRDMPAYAKQNILHHCIKRFQERFEEMAMILCIEAGKPIKDARGEVSRLIDTFKVAAEEAVRIGGEVLELEIAPRAKGYSGMYKRVPIGPCSFISPFNFPLNLAAHKIAPAIAAGCPFVLKPASQTPIGALIIGEVLAETDLPKGAFSILPCHRNDADLFTTDDRLKLLSFTGSPDVGWDLKTRAGKKAVVLELGGNAACIIEPETDIDDAVDRTIFGSFYQSGQSCIGVQRIMIHQSIYEKFKQQFVAATNQLVHGDPKNEETFIGPMISEGEARRLDLWIEEAVTNGATLLCGGNRQGAMLKATVLSDVPSTCNIVTKEAFGPVVVLSHYDDFDEALKQVNDSEFGLQAGIFTRDLYKAHKAWDTLEVGGIVIGDVPSWRVDNMPYGGIKNSGIGREGIKYAIEDMTELRLLVIRTP